ncbi:MAG: hypothetical protein JSV18_06790 [Candidatus Bathyarchaeota archaeon]|nr:MAG: hypothetical protein JSV18_06790 [Candidatus Bathyarchaeota archaeon]
MSEYAGGIVVIETGSPEEALRRAREVKNCPKLLALGTAGNKIFSFYMVPKGNKWWLDYPELFPEERSEAHILETMVYPEALPRITPAKTPPCGADCEGCRFIERYGCKGCLAVTT